VITDGVDGWLLRVDWQQG